MVKEELEKAIEEGWLDRLRARASGAANIGKSLKQRLAPGAGTHSAYLDPIKKAAKLLRIFSSRLTDTPALTKRMNWYLGDLVKDIRKLELQGLELPPNDLNVGTMGELADFYERLLKEMQNLASQFTELDDIAAALLASAAEAAPEAAPEDAPDDAGEERELRLPGRLRPRPPGGIAARAARSGQRQATPAPRRQMRRPGAGTGDGDFRRRR
jgi:hypothetical protein